MNGRRRCDDMKAQLDTVSDQIKQAERAQHDRQHELTAAAAVGAPSASSVDAKPRKSRSKSPELNPRSESPAGKSDDSAANAPSGHQDKKRKRVSEKSPDPENNVSPKEDREQMRQRATEREGVKKASKQLPVKKLSKKLPDGKKRKHAAGDIAADSARGRHSPADKEEVEEGVAAKEGIPGMEAFKELPQLKKKRHLLYKQLQEARQQVPSCCSMDLVFLVISIIFVSIIYWFGVCSHRTLCKDSCAHRPSCFCCCTVCIVFQLFFC